MHTRALWHGIVVDLYFELLDEIGKARSELGNDELAPFQQKHLFVNFFDQELKFVFIAFGLVVKLDDPLFKRNDQSLEEGIVFLFLLSCRKPTIYTHKTTIIYSLSCIISS